MVASSLETAGLMVGAAFCRNVAGTVHLAVLVHGTILRVSKGGVRGRGREKPHPVCDHTCPGVLCCEGCEGEGRIHVPRQTGPEVQCHADHLSSGDQ